jgi:anthranilate synthase/aminodeoxychorismate synthase-like glutamine amidotransferase
MNIIIRTVVFSPGGVHLHVGSGIVHDSVPIREFDETMHKANATLSILTGKGARARMPGVIKGGCWTQPVAGSRHSGARVLLVDNYDSFTYNLAQYISSAGAKVDVFPRDRVPRRIDAYSHIVLSAGPGRPEDAKACIRIVREEEKPILGVCMGHQAIAIAFGGLIKRTEPVHGKVSNVKVLRRSEVLRSVPGRFDAARYHSLVVDVRSVPDCLSVDAITDDGTVMALSHMRRKVYGVQFHPESVLTGFGMAMIEDFLRVKP